ncbi:MAG: hypothetical protein H5T92_00980 [Synergistales bacterium]|nr:hypothetical protein [Synergistales bacterium]
MGDVFYDHPGSDTGFFPFAYSEQVEAAATARAADASRGASAEARQLEPMGEVGNGEPVIGGHGSEGGVRLLGEAQTSSSGQAAEIGRYPGSSGTYIVTRSSFTLPEGRVELIYSIWFQKDMLWFMVLPAWRELRKQVVVAVESQRLGETQARYDRLVCSLAEGMAQGDVRNDFAQALEETREAAKEEARNVIQGAVIGKLAKLGRIGRLTHFADDAAQEIAKDISKAVKRFSRLKLGQQIREYKHLYDTYQRHLRKLEEHPTPGLKSEVDRIPATT